MAASLAGSQACLCTASSARRPVQASAGNFAGLRSRALPLRSAEKQSAIAPISLPNARQSSSRRLSGSTQTSSAVEMYQLADELSYITGVAGVCFAITLVGLAVGFVLLRVEALTEEGKL
ncbi:g8353 [Coccomyxa viridis]|uniref:G8353 protein n=1 Tax=Coccomyxa viridis TaxID=1274662 RepID=A0ABP1G6L7_9CHLO